MTNEQAARWLKDLLKSDLPMEQYQIALEKGIEALEQEPKIKVLDRDEAARKLGTVDVYKARAWITLLKDLEYLGLKICEVKE